ncbi:hypothetical protein L7F22_012333 [Adiantum nelumboides]|nr:hypothetical protein [Adiantum nelumboides]
MAYLSCHARKIQLKNELNTVKKENLSINDYTLKIEDIVESLASIGVQVEDDDNVEVCLRGLAPAYNQFKTSIQTRENIPCFSNLIPMLVVEEKNLGEDSSSSQGINNFEQVIYSNKGRGRGRGAGQGRDRVVAIKIKASSSINQMMRNGQTLVDVEITKAGGVKEVTKISKEIMQIMKIENVGVVKEQDGNVKYLADVLRVPNITKNLVSVGQMVEQGLQTNDFDKKKSSTNTNTANTEEEVSPSEQMYEYCSNDEVDNNPIVKVKTDKEAEAMAKRKSGMPNWLLPDDQEVEEWNLGSEEDPKLIKINKHLKKELKDKAWNLFLKFKDVFAWEHTDLKGVDPKVC